MDDDNVLSEKMQKAIKQSKQLREKARLEENPEEQKTMQARIRRGRIQQNKNIQISSKDRKAGDEMAFGHIKVKYLQDTKARVYVHKNNKATLRLVKGEAGDLIEVLENHPIEPDYGA